MCPSNFESESIYSPTVSVSHKIKVVGSNWPDLNARNMHLTLKQIWYVPAGDGTLLKRPK